MRKVQVRTKCNRAGDFGVLGRRALVRSAILIILLCILTGLRCRGRAERKERVGLEQFFRTQPEWSVRSPRVLAAGSCSMADQLLRGVPGKPAIRRKRLRERPGRKPAKYIRREETGPHNRGGISGLQFAVRHRDELFPGVPIVFFGIDARRIAGQQMWPGVTGVTETVDVRATIDLAFHLHPEHQHGRDHHQRSDFEKYWLAAVHAELLRDHTRRKGD